VKCHTPSAFCGGSAGGVTAVVATGSAGTVNSVVGESVVELSGFLLSPAHEIAKAIEIISNVLKSIIYFINRKDNTLNYKNSGILS
jgi:hypothetical protein